MESDMTDIPLPDCARHLARLWPTVEPEKRGFVSLLRQQLLAWGNGGERDHLRSKIPETIDAIRRGHQCRGTLNHEHRRN
jgi:hypothetical protein